MNLKQLQKLKREIEASIGVLSITGEVESIPQLEAELKAVEAQIKLLQS